jgi:AcrR family transcriptional regulator
MTSMGDRPLRSDAARSRAAVVAAATELFAREGANISLDRVAQHAGVGSATLYRHFPSRRLLLDAVVSSVTAVMAFQAEEALSSQDADGLWHWLDGVVRHCAADRAVVDAARGTAAAAEEMWAPLIEAGRPLLERARAAERVDPGLSMLDILRLLNAVAPAANGDPDEAARLFGLVRHGLAGR